MDATELQQNLHILGELLESRALSYELIVIGGGGLLLLGLMDRPTIDIDVIARRDETAFQVAYELPPQLREAVEDVANLQGVAPDWLNSKPADLFRLGLPDGYEERLTPVLFGSLTLQLVSRYEQICFKLQAWVDRHPGGEKHLEDLRRLQPTSEELVRAAKWSTTHDPSEGFRMGLLGALEIFGVRNVSDV